MSVRNHRNAYYASSAASAGFSEREFKLGIGSTSAPVAFIPVAFTPAPSGLRRLDSPVHWRRPERHHRTAAQRRGIHEQDLICSRSMRWDRAWDSDRAARSTRNFRIGAANGDAGCGDFRPDHPPGAHGMACLFWISAPSRVKGPLSPAHGLVNGVHGLGPRGILECMHVHGMCC